MRNDIPGFEAAVRRERRARNQIYLGTAFHLCGFRVRNITPRIYGILSEAQTPFIFGGSIEDERPFIQFILICQTPGEKTLDEITEAAMDANLEDWRKQIGEFLDLTFLDAPQGGGDEAPIASSQAWMEYRMAGEPFRWDYETKTADTPLRRIYQLIRCQDKEAGRVVTNSLSSKCEGDWLDDVQKQLDAGILTPAMIQEMQARAAAQRAGVPYVPVELNPKEGVNA